MNLEKFALYDIIIITPPHQSRDSFVLRHTDEGETVAEELVERRVSDLRVRCSLPMRPDAIAALDNCNAAADSAVVDPKNGNRHWRCHEHRGQLRPGVTGQVLMTIMVPENN